MPGTPKGIYRYISLLLDQQSVRASMKAAEDALTASGEDGGKSYMRQLKQQFDRGMAELRVKLGTGLIDKKKFQQEANELAQTYNAKLGAALQKLRAEGKLTDDQFGTLAKRMKKVGDDGAQSAGLLERGWKRVAGAIAGLFVMQKVGDFFRDSVKEAVHSEDVWNRLGTTVDSTGVSFKNVEGNLRGLAEEWTKVTRYGDDEFADTLQRLIGMTRDYNASVANVITVAGVAARYHMDLAAAARVVGLAILGETSNFHRMGIVIPEGASAIEYLRQQVQGFAEKDAKTLGGSLDQLKIAWGDYKKAIGFAIVGQNDAADSAQGLTEKIRDQTEWVNRHRDALHGLGMMALWLVTSPFKLLISVMEGGSHILVTAFYGGLSLVTGAAAGLTEAVGVLAEKLGGFIELITFGHLGTSLKTFANDVFAAADRLRTQQWYMHASADRAWNQPTRERKAAAGGSGEAAPTTSQKAAPADPAAKLRAQQTGRVSALKEAADLQTLTTAQIAEAARLEGELRKQLQAGNADEKARKELVGQIKDLQGIRLAQAQKAADAEKKHQDELDKQAEALGKLSTYGALTASQAQLALRLEIQYRAALAGANLTWQQRETIMKRIAALQPATFGLGDLDRGAKTQRSTGTGTDQWGRLGWGKIGATGTGGLIASADTEKAKTDFETLTEFYKQGLGEILTVAQGVGSGWAGAWQDAFGILFSEGANLGKFFETLGRGIAGSLLGGLAQYASGKVAENIASAIEEVAKGLAAASNPFLAWSAPGHFSAAAQHGLAAAAWGVLAGGAGAAQGAVAGGGRGGMSGGIPSGATDIGGRIADKTPGPQTVIVIDPLNPDNPAYHANVYAALEFAKKRFPPGTSPVLVVPRTGSGL